MVFFVYLIYQHRCSFHWFAKQFYPMARTAAQSKRCKVVTYLVFWWSILNTPIGDFIFSLYTPDSLKLVCMASSEKINCQSCDISWYTTRKHALLDYVNNWLVYLIYQCVFKYRLHTNFVYVKYQNAFSIVYTAIVDNLYCWRVLSQCFFSVLQNNFR